MTAPTLVAIHFEDRQRMPWLPFAAPPGAIVICDVDGAAMVITDAGRAEPTGAPRPCTGGRP